MKQQAKVILIGNSGVGKSCWLQTCYTQTTTVIDYSTVGAQFNTMMWNNFRLNLWDTAGQERYASVVDMFFRNSDMILIFYSADDIDSQNKIKYWRQKCEMICPEAIIFVICNKIDTLDTIDQIPKLNIDLPCYFTTIYDLNTINKVLDDMVILLKQKTDSSSLRIYDNNINSGITDIKTKYNTNCCYAQTSQDR
jgi:small GTP-binding protein